MSCTGSNPRDTRLTQILKTFYCYQCERMVCAAPSQSEDAICSLCDGGFMEECENPPDFVYNENPGRQNQVTPYNHNPTFHNLVISDPFSLFFPPHFQEPRYFPAQFPHPQFVIPYGPPNMVYVQDTNLFNPLAYLENHLRGLRDRGANIQFIIQNAPLGADPPGNIRDYFMGPGFEDLIQQLAENDPNRYGTPPAAESAIESLPSLRVSEELIASDSSDCPVCTFPLELDVEVKEMPCKHIFHSHCIVRWLELHNTCPVCRFELPTDDPDYENRREPRSSSAGSVTGRSRGGGRGGRQQQDTRVWMRTQRSIRITIPLPYPAPALPHDTNQNDSQTNNGESNADGGDPPSNSGPIQEDLD